MKSLDRIYNGLSTYMLILEKNQYFSLHNTKLIKYINLENIRKAIPQGILRSYLSDDKFYQYLLKVIDNNQGMLRCCYLDDEMQIKETICISDCINLLKKEKNLDLIEKNRLNELQNKTNYTNYISSVNNKKYKFILDNKEIEIDIGEMLNLLICDEANFKDLLTREKISNIETKIYFYGMNKFLSDNNIIKNFVFPKDVLSRYRKIHKCSYIDFQSINFFEDKNKIRYDVEISNNLRKLIYKNMNMKFSTLEKSIYIYIMLCKLFSYDEEFFVENQKGEIARYHENINRLKEIEGKEDLIVCYEFNAIYGKLLEDLNIEYNINVLKGEGYGKYHANLDYVVDKFIISADSLTSIINGDLVNAKLNIRLKGLKCLNSNTSTKREFEKHLNKVYDYIIINQNDSNNYIIALLSIYNTLLKIDNEDKKLAIDKKIKLIVDLVNSSKLNTMDAIGYLYKISKKVFNEIELNNLKITIIVKLEDNVKKPFIVFSNKENGQEEYTYYGYTIGENINKYTIEEIENLFYKGKLKYINNKSNKIPGINIGRKL